MDDLTKAATELARTVERHFEQWIASHPGLESPQGQMVVFTLAAKRLARAHVGMTPLVAQVFRAYELRPEGIHIEDDQGEVLVHFEDSGPREDVVYAPGSRRRDN